MELVQILSINFSIEKNKKNLPINIYALRLLNKKTNEITDIAIQHNGFCPSISSEREQSNYNDYLSNLEYSIINDFSKSKKIRKTNDFSSIGEVMTNQNGELYHYSRLAN